MNKITRENFASQMFKRDKEHNLWPKCKKTWNSLTDDEKNIYLTEADYHIEKHPRDDWPTCIKQ